LNKFFTAIGISKQSFHQHLRRRQKQSELEMQVLKVVSEVRKDHPGMNVRDIYFKMRPGSIGRDRFEQLCRELGLGVARCRNLRRTTNSSGVKRFENLISERKATAINEVWQSDITYYELKGRFYYLTFIQDACSKMIVGYSISKSLHTHATTIPALQMALGKRGGSKRLKGLILHSDGGGQYYSDEFLKLTGRAGMINSMGKMAQENGMAERLNGVIKNNYLRYKSINTFEDLVKQVDRTVHLYNVEKPHKSLKRKTPFQFEKGYKEQTGADIRSANADP
jgi:transposase InsO family protein